MKKDKIIYRATTGLFSALMFMNAYMYFTSPKMIEGFRHIGFTDFFRKELAIAKIIGAIVLLVPAFPSKIKEWAYAGFGITFIAAALAHYAVNDPTTKIVMPLFFLVFLFVSNFYFSKTTNNNH